jgi:transcriptional regulator with XRE-family HTH domain
MTQVEAADLIGIKQPNVSLLLRGRTENYSVGRLITLLNLLGHDVIIAHREKPRSQRVGRTRVGVLKAAVGAVAEEGTTDYRAGAKRCNVGKTPGPVAKRKMRG